MCSWFKIKHSSYSQIIMLEKYCHPDLNVFHLKWLVLTQKNCKNQTPVVAHLKKADTFLRDSVPPAPYWNGFLVGF